MMNDECSVDGVVTTMTTVLYYRTNNVATPNSPLPASEDRSGCPSFYPFPFRLLHHSSFQHPRTVLSTAGRDLPPPRSGTTKVWPCKTRDKRTIDTHQMVSSTDDTPASVTAATRVFNLPEILEIILLSIPAAFDCPRGPYGDRYPLRFIRLSRTASRTWDGLIETSTPLRQLLYLPTPLGSMGTPDYDSPAIHPWATVNPWIPPLLLRQRSWGAVEPFDEPTSSRERKIWTFVLELSREQYNRIAPRGPWREMIATSPPFSSFWYSRCFYELGSGRTPDVEHLDYDGRLPKARQEYCFRAPGGVTLGDIVDAIGELFEKHPDARFVIAESLPVNGRSAVK